MARDLNEARDSSVGTNTRRSDGASTQSNQTATKIAGELAADAYNIVAALGFLTLSYWILFRNLPAELFTLGLVAMALIVVNVVVAVRGRTA